MLQNEEWLRGFDRWAVLGVNENEEGYANQIYHRLKAYGKTVAGVNPFYTSIDTDPVFPSLHKLPFKPDVVVSVVRPSVGMFYLEEMKNYGMRRLWLQPGTVDDTLLARCKEFKIEALQACVLMGLDFIIRRDSPNKP